MGVLKIFLTLYLINQIVFCFQLLITILLLILLKDLIGNKKCFGETINLGTGYDFSIGNTLNSIQKILKKNVNVITQKERIRPEKSEVDRLLSSNKKARKILKWKPKYIGSTGFKKGLEKTIEWFNDKENLSHYNINIYNV